VNANRASISDSEYAARRSRAAAEAAARGLDGLLVWGRGGTLDTFSDVHYFTGFFSPFPWCPPMPPKWEGISNACVVISTDGNASLLTNEEFTSAGGSIAAVRRNANICTELISAIRDHGLDEGRVGVLGMEVLPYSFAAALESACPGLTLSDADDISTDLRGKLSQPEVTMLEQACTAGVQIYRALIDRAAPGRSEGEVIGAGYAEAARIPGCMPWAFLSASGPDAASFVSAAFPPWNPSYRYEHGDVVHIDAYGFVDGYAYDFGRTLIVGHGAAGPHERVIRSVREAATAISEEIKPGATCRLLYETGTAFLKHAGLIPASGSFGHALGAGFFRPYINPDEPYADRPLAPPIGIAIEIFASDGEGHYAFHEDNFVLLEEGVKCLTSAV
jgi:Xaa-Pro aminopeptidase